MPFSGYGLRNRYVPYTPVNSHARTMPGGSRTPGSSRRTNSGIRYSRPVSGPRYINRRRNSGHYRGYGPWPRYARRGTFRGGANLPINKIKKTKKISQREKSLATYSNKGILTTHEVGFSTTGCDDCAYIGHATFIRSHIFAQMCYCIVKKLTIKAGFQFKSLNDTSPWLTGDTINVLYKLDQEPASAELTVSVACTTGETLFTLCGLLDTAAEAVFTEDSTITRARAVSGARNIDEWIQLYDAKLHVNVQSNLKFQNQTLGVGGADEDTADEVGNQPVQGKQYEGPGSGTMNKASDVTGNIAFQAIDDSTGLYLQDGSAVNGFLEPPPAKFFSNVKKCQGVVVKPGEIKNSVLKDVFVMKVNTILKHLVSPWLGISKPKRQMGTFRFFALEHMMKCVETQPDIIINGEHNFRIGVMLELKRDTWTTEFRGADSYVTY